MRTVARITLWGLLVLGLTGITERTMAQGDKKAPPATTAGVKTKIQVTLPQEDAELLIEDKLTKATGLKRDFETPNIDGGKTYEYKFTTKFRPNNYTQVIRNKTVTFKGGEPVTVDMTKDDPNDKAVIRFVPTPDDIVKVMVQMAKITKDDVVYEPGCGDARILAAAVKAGAKKGIGIDLDPERITEAKETMKKAMLDATKVDVRQGDALDFKEFPEVTVVMIYMGDEFDMIIRPHLWKNLKIGSRVVSHRFLFGDWKPDETKKITGADGDEYELHVWTITKEIKDKAAKATTTK